VTGATSKADSRTRPRARPTGRVLAAAVVVVTILAPAQAAADWYIAPFIGVVFGGETTIVDLEQAAKRGNLTFGGTVTYLGSGIFGIEVDFAMAPGYFQRDLSPADPLIGSSRVTMLMGNVIVTAPLKWTGYSLRPYASGGFGLVRASIDDVFDILRVRENLPGFNVGGGVLGLVSDRTGVKWDVRFFRGSGGDPGVSLGSTQFSAWRATMALVIRLGPERIRRPSARRASAAAGTDPDVDPGRTPSLP
jgi:hypothetical protein